MTHFLRIPELSAVFVKILSAIGAAWAASMAVLLFVHATSKTGRIWVEEIMHDFSQKTPRWVRMLIAAFIFAGIVAVALNTLFQTEKNAAGVALRRDLNGLAASIWGQLGDPDDNKFGERIDALVKRVKNDGLYSKEFREACLVASVGESRPQAWTNMVNVLSNTAMRIKTQDEK